jgi:hypothetical protein
LLLRIFKSFHYASAISKNIFVLDQYENDKWTICMEMMLTKAKDNKKTQDTKVWWAKGVADVNSKFIVLFFLKIILKKSTFLGGLQNLKWAWNLTSTRKQNKKKYKITKAIIIKSKINRENNKLSPHWGLRWNFWYIKIWRSA